MYPEDIAKERKAFSRTILKIIFALMAIYFYHTFISPLDMPSLIFGMLIMMLMFSLGTHLPYAFYDVELNLWWLSAKKSRYVKLFFIFLSVISYSIYYFWVIGRIDLSVAIALSFLTATSIIWKFASLGTKRKIWKKDVLLPLRDMVNAVLEEVSNYKFITHWRWDDFKLKFEQEEIWIPKPWFRILNDIDELIHHYNILHSGLRKCMRAQIKVDLCENLSVKKELCDKFPIRHIFQKIIKGEEINSNDLLELMDYDKDLREIDLKRIAEYINKLFLNDIFFQRVKRARDYIIPDLKKMKEYIRQYTTIEP
ncbi:MAG: hypothetical protein ACP6IS_11160 [Candidatus Asgardarchaeia archaeon]